jgi:deazaflavin-dependent oxidoreductase (nitroreductase family)
MAGSTLSIGDGHNVVVIAMYRKERMQMATVAQAPLFARMGNVLTTALLRAGFKLMGFRRYPMYLLTVRGRKSGKPRTVSMAILERDGRRYLGAPFGTVNWVRNLRAAGEATLTRGRRTETVSARELAPAEAALILRDEVKEGHPFARYLGVTPASSLEEFERAAAGHPLFLLEAK